tara:strand:- start:4095 stop:5126 length:1032 start_codon:yes stop_codon:yes gene_type:complete
MVVPFQSSFIKSDIDILSSQHSIILNTYNWKNKYFTPVFMFFQLLSLLKNIRIVEGIVIEFGGYWALIPSVLGKLFNIPVIIILHGTDCASMPHVPYGSLRKKLLKLVCEISYRYSSILLPVSKSLIHTENDYNDKYICQGINYHFPSCRTKIKVLHNGLDIAFWSPRSYTNKESNRFISVFSENQFILKGGDLILSLAEQYPNYNFYIAGTKKPRYIDKKVNNVHFLGRLTREELREEYRNSTFHLQLSMFEGFGLSLCEAMLCECIPIGSSVNIIPDIIGYSGFVLDKKDINQLIKIVDKATALHNKAKLGANARRQILTNYPISKREELLLETVSNQITK